MSTNKNGIVVSIVVPVYNMQEYLPRFLESIFGQVDANNSPFKGLEIVAVNDGSSDESLSLLTRFVENVSEGQDLRVISRPNTGVWQARLDGVRAAKGDWIGFADPDDLVEPNFVHELLKTATDADADMSMCNYSRFDENGHPSAASNMVYDNRAFSFNSDPGAAISLNGALWNKLYKAEILKNMPVIAHPPGAIDDIMFGFLALIGVNKVAKTESVLYHYLERSDSDTKITNREKVQQSARALLEVCDKWQEAVKGASKAEYSKELVASFAFVVVLGQLFLLRSVLGVRFFKENIDARAFLKKNFPAWDKSPYLSLGYVIKHGGGNAKLFISKWIVRLGCFGLALRVLNRLKR